MQRIGPNKRKGNKVVENLAQFLTSKTIQLDDLLLDPNNPRFSELGDDYSVVAEARYGDPTVQKNAFEKMRNPTFSVSELRDTIKTIGFLPMDRIVVRNWNEVDGVQKYVVIEGNRRVTALKWLIQLGADGKETFDEDQLQNYTELGCLVLDDSLAPQAASLILPGLRHVSGIKEWGPYQKAKAIFRLRQTGMAPQEAAQSLGLSTRAANNSYRCFVALENMADDEDFQDHVTPDMYSYFEELFKKPPVRNWLEWDDNSEAFTNKKNLHEFYSWIVKPENPDEIHKLPEAKSIRDLATIINDEAAVNVLRSKDGTLSRALAKYEIDHPEDWYPKITAAAGALKLLTPDMLRGMDDVTLASITDLRDQILVTLEDKNKLAG